MENKFEWTDELVKEFGDLCNQEGWHKFSGRNKIDNLLSDFKKSKESKKGYEILSFISPYSGRDNVIFKKLGNGLFDEYDVDEWSGKFSLGYLLSHTKAKIHSVKRLSDGLVYTIGDIVGCILNDTVFDIEEIELSGEPYLINQKLKHYLPLRNAYKTKYPININEELIDVKLTKHELYKLRLLLNE